MRSYFMRWLWRLVDWQTKRYVVWLEIELSDTRRRLDALERSHAILLEEAGRHE